MSMNVRMDFAAERARLVEHLRPEISDEPVLAAMARVPRERFVPPEYRPFAYEDRPLAIGLDQTISQPYVVALMSQALALTGWEKVLEVGTGSGYQAAVLSLLARSVVSVERLAPLAENARRVLAGLGCNNVQVVQAEETLGCQRGAPYDAIVVTAGSPCVPVDLLAQLAMNGRLVIPVGSRHMQELYRVTRLRQGNRLENLGPCRFVPLIGKGAWPEE